MQPVLPMLLFSSPGELTVLQRKGAAALWDIHLNLTMDARVQPVHRAWQRKANCSSVSICPSATAWQSISFWKTSALIQTPFERTLFLDNDVYVLQPSFVYGLLAQTLRVSDIAMPINVDRGGAWQESPVPQPCNALIAYRRTSDVAGLLVGAVQRIVSGQHPGVQQRDQDMLLFEWLEARTQLRFLMLPEEYYCPDQDIGGITAHVKLWKKASRQISNLTADRLAVWKVPWASRSGPLKVASDASRSSFPCKAVHGHAKLYRTLASKLRDRLNTSRLPSISTMR